MLAILSLLACRDPSTQHDKVPPAFDWNDTSIEDIPGDSGETGDTGDTDDTGSTTHENADFMFLRDRVIEIAITVDEDDLNSLKRQPKEYVPASIVIDGERVKEVGIRLKGSSSFRKLRQKSAFKIDFNRFDDGQDFYGIGKLTLNNMLNDETQLHEVCAYAAFAAAGLPYSRVGYAWVTLNGDAYGLYANIETPSKPWIERLFGTEDGNLYEGGYPYYPESYTHADFSNEEAGNFNLESGEDVATADTKAVAAQVQAKGADWDTRVGALVDLEEYAKFQVAEAWVGQWDGYAFASNNYRVYFPADGSGMKMVPSGLDWTFTDYGSDWAHAASPLGARCQADSVCEARFAQAAIDVTTAVDAADLGALLDVNAEMIRPYIEDDPRKELQIGSLDKAHETMRTWIRGRSEKVLKWY